MTGEIMTVPPAAIFIVGALLIPLFKGKLRQAYMLLIAVAAILDVYFMHDGVYWLHPFMEYELILGRVDLLSKCFAYVFTIAALAMTFYALRVAEAGEHIAAFLYIGSARSWRGHRSCWSGTGANRHRSTQDFGTCWCMSWEASSYSAESSSTCRRAAGRSLLMRLITRPLGRS
jgi:hypothetical protein